jgi:hypothetical protein
MRGGGAVQPVLSKMNPNDIQLKFRVSQWKNQEFYDSFAIRLLDGELEIGGVRAPNPGRGKDFLFCAASRPAVGQIHLPDNGYRGLLPYGYNGQIMNLITHFSLRPKVKHNWSFAFTLHTSSYRGV